jgi:hypothetical protein
LRILYALVAGRHPVADEFFRRRLGPAPIAQEHHRVGPAHGDLALFIRRADAAVGADDRNFMARHGLADAAGPADADGSAGGEHEIALGLAIGLVDGEPQRLTAPGQGLRAQRLTGGRDRAQLERESADAACRRCAAS